MTREKLYPIIFAAVLLLLWEVAARLSGNHFFPSFLDTLAALRNNFGLIASQMGMTLLRAAIGLGIAAITMMKGVNGKGGGRTQASARAGPA